MIHPDTELRYVNATIGFGIYATKAIPLGTIVYAKDELDIEVDSERFRLLPRQMQESVEKYSYIDERGIRILSWDTAKYVNHSCDCNTMSTGYGFEIAVRDIPAGDEITDEYGLFNSPEIIPLACGCKGCREFIYPDDVDVYHDQWDSRVKEALKQLASVAQPLWGLIEPDILDALSAYLEKNGPYRSVYGLKYRPRPDVQTLFCRTLP